MTLRHAWLGAIAPFAVWLVLQHPVQQRLLLAASPLFALPYLVLAVVRRRDWRVHLASAATCLLLSWVMLWDTRVVDAKARAVLARATAITPCGPTREQLRAGDPRWSADAPNTMRLRLRGYIAARQRVRFEDGDAPLGGNMFWGYRGMANDATIFACRDGEPIPK